jgi:hypothetical protein
MSNNSVSVKFYQALFCRYLVIPNLFSNIGWVFYVTINSIRYFDFLIHSNIILSFGKTIIFFRCSLNNISDCFTHFSVLNSQRYAIARLWTLKQNYFQLNVDVFKTVIPLNPQSCKWRTFVILWDIFTFSYLGMNKIIITLNNSR